MNSYCFHYGGTSFKSSKTEYVKKNLILLNNLYPDYNKMIRFYKINSNYFKEILAVDMERLAKKLSQTEIIIFDQKIGGGAVARCGKWKSSSIHFLDSVRRLAIHFSHSSMSLKPSCVRTADGGTTGRNDCGARGAREGACSDGSAARLRGRTLVMMFSAAWRSCSTQ